LLLLTQIHEVSGITTTTVTAKARDHQAKRIIVGWGRRRMVWMLVSCGTTALNSTAITGTIAFNVLVIINVSLFAPRKGMVMYFIDSQYGLTVWTHFPFTLKWCRCIKFVQHSSRYIFFAMLAFGEFNRNSCLIDVIG
jgi:hypothetical protein